MIDCIDYLRQDDRPSLQYSNIADQKRGEKMSDLLSRFFKADDAYHELARATFPNDPKPKMIKNYAPAQQCIAIIQGLKIPPAIISLQLRPDGDYKDAPTVVRFGPGISIMGGISAPKLKDKIR